MHQQEWKGATSNRFSGGRKHEHPSDSLSMFMREVLPTSKIQGLKTYSHNPTKQQQFKPCIKVFTEGNMQTQQAYPRGKKLNFTIEYKQRLRKQKKHIEGGKQTNGEFIWKGIRTFDKSYKQKNNHYSVQNMLQRKKQVDGLENKRNNIEVASLGDKAYKYPQHSTNYYHNGGLIVGSTNSYNGKKSSIQGKIAGVLKKPNWDIKVKMEKIEQDKRVVNSVDQWEKTTLKQGNPNWKDPDTFFERQEALKANQGGAKGAKKGK